MRIKTFFDKIFREYSVYDTERSIPNIVDGLKISQRKVIYGMIKNGGSEIKVARASGFISGITDYHHGEDSLNSTIVKLAQNYPGSNNLNLLEPEGQFGSRLSPSAAAPRYIFTKLSDNFRKLFKKDDDIILEYLYSDGQQIEPKYYIPILPTILINGALGMGTGYACKILCYNPEHLRKNILNILHGKNPRKIIPWYKDFKGTITKDGKQVIIEGKYEIVNTTTMKIIELPIGTYLDKYKEHLGKLMDKGIIKDFDDDSSEDGFLFTITIPRSTSYMDHDKILSTFKLISKTSENFTMWDEKGFIKIFDEPQEVIDHFVVFRLEKYEERRIKKIELLNTELDWLNEKMKFIQYYIDNSQLFAKKKKDLLFKMLEKEGFVHIDRLLSMKIYTLTKDSIDALKIQIKNIKNEIKELKSTNNVDMYIKELEELSF